MNIDLTSEQRDFGRLAVETGRLNDSADAVREAMNLWAIAKGAASNLLRCSIPPRRR